MKSLIQIFKENLKEEVLFLEEALSKFKEPDEVNLRDDFVESIWEFRVKEDETIPPLNLMEFSKMFCPIELYLERENSFGVRMLRNLRKKPEGMGGYLTLFSFTQPTSPEKGEENFLLQLGDGKFLIIALKTVEEKGIGRKFFEKFRIGDRILTKNFEVEEVIYEFNERYKEPLFSCSLIKGDVKQKKLDFLLIGNIQGCAITPKYHHLLFPQNLYVGGDSRLKCEFYPLFLIVPSLFLLYTEDLPVERIRIPEISLKKFIEFVNFILSNQKKGMVISFILAERKGFESSE